MEQKNSAPNRKIAREYGFVTYFGSQCSRFKSHGKKRYTNSGKCVGCDKAKSTPQWQAAMMDELASRPKPVTEPYTAEQEARLEEGSAYRFYGNPCRHGHDGLRYVKGGACVDCVAENLNANRLPSRLTKSERREWRKAKRMGDEHEKDRLRSLSLSRAALESKETQLQVIPETRLLWIVVAASV